MDKARAAFGAMKKVVFDRAAAETVVEAIDRLGAPRGPLTVSGMLGRATSEIRHEIRKITPGFPREIDGPAQIREIILLAA